MTGTEVPQQHRPDGPLLAASQAVETGFDRLARAVDDYRKIRADVGSFGASPDPDRLDELRTAEQAVSDCIRALGWRSPTENGPATTTCQDPDPQSASGGADPQLVRATLALVDGLADADRDSGALVDRLTRAGDQSCPGLLRAALHCQGLVADALLIGAIELADRIGIPASRLPL